MKIDHIILRDLSDIHLNLLPISYTRPVSEIRMGILTIREKWTRRLGCSWSWLTEEYLSEKFPAADPAEGTVLTIDSNILPDEAFVNEILSIATPNNALYCYGRPIGTLVADASAPVTTVELRSTPMSISWIYDIFMKNSEAIAEDFRLITAGRTSAPLDPSCTLIGDSSSLFLEEGAKVTGAFLNVSEGPIYIASTATVMEGSCLRGPIACCEYSQVNMGAKIYGATTLGTYCKVGGELNNVVMQGYSNKAHDGFLGNAVIGEWCNLGAGCVASNLKNDYTEIKLWNYPAHRFLRTGLQFCGLIMGDHSKAGINTMFNTATVVGVGVNIHGTGFPRNFVASFCEGSPSGYADVPMSKFLDIARRMMARRHIELSEADVRLFEAIRHISEDYK